MSAFDRLALDNSYARLPQHWCSPARLQPYPSAALAQFNTELAGELGLDAAAGDNDVIGLCNGSHLPESAEPIATAYAGHQFGVFVPQLGDGRAALLGELIDPQGRRWDLQLKGAGPTAYSRGGDGRAVLRSTLREYLASEAMHGLGIPTTRALAMITSESPVFRERVEPGAVLLRVAPSHLRFGHFEWLYHRGREQELRLLADYSIERHYPELSGPESHLRFYRAVLRRTAELVAAWQSVGFVHGVMNTDNMSIAGVTLDYGPFGFVETYEAASLFNHSDAHGRYRLDRQPSVAMWNLGRLAQALVPLVPAPELQTALDEFPAMYTEFYYARMVAKLGLPEADAEDRALVDDLLTIMQRVRVDYTASFRELARAFDGGGDALRLSFGQDPQFETWLQRYRRRGEAGTSAGPAADRQGVNPTYVLRTHLAQRAIEALEQDGDAGELTALLELLANPYAEQAGREDYAAPPAGDLPSPLLSCSS